MDFLSGLNPQQAEAVRHVDGPLLILAGAGSGKTRVITHRMAHMVVERGIAPWSILAVTFTNKAAKEMRERVGKLLEGKILMDPPMVTTFHSFCVRLLRRDGEKLAEIRPGFTRSFAIYDDDDQVSLVKGIIKRMGVDDKTFAPRSVLSVISNWKCDKTSPAEAATGSRDPGSKTISAIYEAYEGGLRAANALDFDDLLLEAVRLLEHDKQVREAWNQRVRYLLVDEYQDTNRNQYDMMRLLAGKSNNVCVVGDEDQSIYSWRGADIRNILDFERDFGNATVIRLEQNYRSTKSILEAAGAVVANNKARKGKKLWTAGAVGDHVSLYEAIDGDNEAMFIADMIEKELRDHPKDRVAVLYRTNSQSRLIEEALRRYRRKYAIVGGFSFFQRAEIKDLLAYLRVMLTPTDNIALNRVINVPARGIGKTTMDVVDNLAQTHKISLWEAIEKVMDMPEELGSRAIAALKAFRDIILEVRNVAASKTPLQVLETIVDRSGYQRMLDAEKGEEGESRRGNVQELLTAAGEASERGETLADFLDHAALVSDADQADEEAQVSLLTIHNAKGLEFPVVFLAGMEEGLFPHKRSIDSEDSIEEERRLCYVGMTRAMRKLFISHARSRRRYGGGPPEPSIASRFLKEIPPSTVKKLNNPAGSAREVELFSEQYEVRNSARKNLYTGKTYNSVENIAQFFKDRGTQAPPPPRTAAAPAAPMSRPPQQPMSRPGGSPPPSRPAGAVPPRPSGMTGSGMSGSAPSFPRPSGGTGQPGVKPAGKPGSGTGAKGKLAPGSIINHPTLGRGTIVKKEGDGPDAKLTVNFPGAGLKKLIAKFAGLNDD